MQKWLDHILGGSVLRVPVHDLLGVRNALCMSARDSILPTLEMELAFPHFLGCWVWLMRLDAWRPPTLAGMRHATLSWLPSSLKGTLD